MKRSLISLCCLLVTYLLFSQDNSKEYLDLIEKGRSLIRAKDYKNAAITFSSAISLASDKDPIFAHHRAAFSWALANYPDSAFYHLNFIANLKDLSFKDVDDIITDDDYTSILNDMRWQDVKDKMFLTAYETFLSAQKKAGGKIITHNPSDLAFARALGNNNVSAFSHLNDEAYRFLGKRMFDKADKLFKVSINNFPPNYTLYQNMMDYYMATVDKGRAYVYFSRAEVVKYKQPAIISDTSLKIDSALKAEYRVFSKKIGYEVLPPEYLVTTVANAILKNGKADTAYGLFKMNMKNYPNSYSLYKEIGNFYVKKGEKEKANEYFSKSFILQYKLPDSFFKSSYNLKEYFNSRDEYLLKNRGDKIFQSEGFFNNLGNHFLSNKMFDKAEVLFKMSMEKHPQSLNVYTNMIAFYKATDNKEKIEELNKEVQAIKTIYQQRGITGTDILPDTTYNIQVANPACQSNCPTILIQDNGRWSNGRHKSFANLIANDGARIILNQNILTKQSLEQANVVVIVGNRMNNNEIQNINDWVRQGGSLLAITHHDELHFDEFLKSLGVQTNEINVTVDPIYGIERDGVSANPAYIVFAEKDKLLGDHIIIGGRNNAEKIRQVKTFGGGRSIIGPPGSSILLPLSKSAVDYMTIDPNQDISSRVAVETKGLRSYGIAFTLGKGKIVVLSSALILTATLFPPGWGKMGMNNPGSDNKQFALNIMRWLTSYLK